MADPTTAPDVNSTPAFPVEITGGIPWISFDAQVEDMRKGIARHFDSVDYAEAKVYPENRKRYEIVYYSHHRNGMADQQRIWFMNKKDHKAWKEMVEDIITLGKEALEEENNLNGSFSIQIKASVTPSHSELLVIAVGGNTIEQTGNLIQLLLLLLMPLLSLGEAGLLGR